MKIVTRLKGEKFQGVVMDGADTKYVTAALANAADAVQSAIEFCDGNHWEYELPGAWAYTRDREAVAQIIRDMIADLAAATNRLKELS